MRSSHGPTNRESEASGQKRSASSAATEEASEPPPQKLLQNAEWPVALPPPIHTNSQNAVVIVSLMAGNSHWDWTVHSGGAAHEFEGTIPWRYESKQTSSRRSTSGLARVVR